MVGCYSIGNPILFDFPIGGLYSFIDGVEDCLVGNAILYLVNDCDISEFIHRIDELIW